MQMTVFHEFIRSTGGRFDPNDLLDLTEWPLMPFDPVLA
jgi:hypothetical protein